MDWDFFLRVNIHGILKASQTSFFSVFKQENFAGKSYKSDVVTNEHEMAWNTTKIQTPILRLKVLEN